MLIRSLLGVAALLVATSCVPALTAPVAPPAITASEATLLHRLALAAPVADAPEDDADPAPLAVRRATPLAAAPPFAGLASHGDDTARATDCLTAAVYYEARSESADGQRAVAQVVLNRVRDRAFPGSVCGVVYQRSVKGCQFSFACDGSTRHAVDPSAWERARRIAAAAFGGAVYTPVGAATYYHTAAVSPWWAPSLARIGQIGAHIFYGWRSAMAQALTFRRSYAGIEPDAAPPIAHADAAPDTAVADVTVHRGDPADAPAPLASAAVVTMAGVRIHRHAGTPPAMMVAAMQIGPESDERAGNADPI